MALAAAADFTPVYQFAQIPANIRQIVAIAKLSGERPKKLMSSYYKLRDGTGTPDEKIAEQEQQVGDAPEIVLHYTAPRDWTPGKYRLDVSADGQPWQSTQWEVVPPMTPPALASAEDIMPIRVGTTWPMAFTSWSSPDVRVTLPGAERDANGVYHMNAAITIPGMEPDGIHVRHTRDGKLAEEELWHLGASGIAVIGRLAGAKPLRVEPPLPIIPYPLPGPENSWDWRSGEEGQWKFRGWGPVLLPGPNGEQPGYVIVMEQPTAARTMTRERDIIPGLGISRETFADQIGSGVTLFHQEYVLTGMPRIPASDGSSDSEKP
ncbi:MAG: hypothetical protein JO358_14770 [Alphaproteobacteria bacterium]|nr:hypothetical protein [Alphaproteobacteria bacterium]